MDAILLAAGRGTRMAPLTPELAKPLLPVAGRSLLVRMLDALAEAGVDTVHIVTGHQAEAVEAAAGAWEGPADVRFHRQARLRGTGDAVATAAAATEGDVLVVTGDCVVDAGVLRALADADGFTMAVAQADDPSRYGVVQTDAEMVTGLEEKPERPASDLVNTGLYKVPKEALDQCQHLQDSPRGEREFTDVVRRWAADGRVRHVPATGWLDVSAPWDLLDAQAAVLSAEFDARPAGSGPGTVEGGVHVDGRLWVEEGAIVRSGTYVQGEVLVLQGADVGPNAYLRGPTCIGPDCRVGGATEVKASLLMDGANAPHHNYVGDSILGPGVNLGAGTKIANLRFDHGEVAAGGPDGPAPTGRKKFGAALGPTAQTGINASLLPGTLVDAGAWIDAGAVARGWVSSRRAAAFA